MKGDAVVEMSDPSSARWFVTLPDGRQLGPLTDEQMWEANRRGILTPESLVRRDDWTRAVPNATFLAEQSPGSDATPAGNAPAPADPLTDASYSEQFLRNPLGTYFLGPRMSAYQGDRSAAVQAARKRHFRWWLYGLATMLLAAVLVPLVAGWLGRDAETALGLVLLSVFWSFWPTLFFLLGMLLYAGAWFEWRWFFQSRTLRAARAMFGNTGARRFYLVFGAVLMVGGLCFSLGGSLVLGGSALFARNPQQLARKPRQAPPAPDPARDLVGRAAKRLADERAALERVAVPLREAVAETARLERQIGDRPHDLELRQQLFDAERRVGQLFPAYQAARRQWQNAVDAHAGLKNAGDRSSPAPPAAVALPPDMDFSDDIVPRPVDQFPIQNVRSAVEQLEERRKAMDRLLERPGGASEGAVRQTARQIEQLRGFLRDVENRWNYRSPQLDLPSGEELAARYEPRPPAEPARIPGPFAAPAASGPRIGGSPPSPKPPRAERGHDLLASFDASRQTLRGSVTMAGTGRQRSLLTEAMERHALAYFPSAPLRAEYEFEADVTRVAGEGGLFFVLPIQAAQAALVIDGGDELGHRTGLVAIDNLVLRSPNYPGKPRLGTQFPPRQTVHLRCRVETGEAILWIDDVERYRWRGDVSRLSLPPFYRSPHRSQLHAGSFHSRFEVANLRLRLGPTGDAAGN